MWSGRRRITFSMGAYAEAALPALRSRLAELRRTRPRGLAVEGT